MTDRRFIEESFPVKEVGEASVKEKNIHFGHISTMHIWWARRPLAASRATAYAALTPAPTSIEEWQKKRDFIIELSKWENSNNQQLLERARQDILDANGGVPPKVLDPFSGGGSYPLEALRLGCETYANDYNPVAVLIEKATLEYPQKFGHIFNHLPEWAMPKENSNNTNKPIQTSLFKESKSFNPLLEAVKYWGEIVLKEARIKLNQVYPQEETDYKPVGYIWARTIQCQNPVCKVEIPIMRQFWLSKKEKKKVALYLEAYKDKIGIRLVGDGYEEWPPDYDPEAGTVSRAMVTCPICHSVISGEEIKKSFFDGKKHQRMMVVIMKDPHRIGKKYRIPTSNDEIGYEKANGDLQDWINRLSDEWGINPIPDELLPPKDSHRSVGSQLPLYNFQTWGDIFNSRQKLALIVFTQVIREIYAKILENQTEPEFAKAVITYLALGLDRLANRSSILNVWNVSAEKAEQVFIRQALAMLWDYCEVVTIGDQGWETQFSYILSPLKELPTSTIPVSVQQYSATNLPWPDDYFDAVLTDPPYYDNVPYSYLSDFFYVWLKRSIGFVFPELFITSLSPKKEEIVAYIKSEDGTESGSTFFEKKIKIAFQEIYRVLKPNGISVIVYAHKSTTGWESIINALQDSGLTVVASWPINTERLGRMNANETASLASSIYIVVRKMPRQPTGFYNDVRTELRSHLEAKLQRLWGEGIGGADFFIAAIGSAIEVFGKYEQVMDFEGNIVRADRLLDEVRTIATDYAVRQILHNGFATEISDLSRLYVLWRWNYGEALVPFDEGRKLAQSCGIDLSQQWGKNGFIKKEKGFIRLLGPQNRKFDDLDDPRDMIDVLHKALLLWEQSKRVEMIQTLAEHRFGKNEAFYRVAQAISETLPNESKEKKLLDGFLAGRERVQQEVEKVAAQGRLWE